MVSTDDNVVDEVIDDGITGWLNGCGGDTGSEYELWMEEEMNEMRKSVKSTLITYLHQWS